jgi:hypothetical protein
MSEAPVSVPIQAALQLHHALEEPGTPPSPQHIGCSHSALATYLRAMPWTQGVPPALPKCHFLREAFSNYLI